MRQLANKNIKTAIINTVKGKYEHNENRDEKYIKEPNRFSKIKNVIQNMENPLNGLNGRLGNAQGKISELEDIAAETTETEELEEK